MCKGLTGMCKDEALPLPPQPSAAVGCIGVRRTQNSVPRYEPRARARAHTNTQAPTLPHATRSAQGPFSESYLHYRGGGSQKTLAERLAKANSLLDVGCGDGSHTRRMVQTHARISTHTPFTPPYMRRRTEARMHACTYPCALVHSHTDSNYTVPEPTRAQP